MSNSRMARKILTEEDTFVPCLSLNDFHQSYKINLNLRARHYGVSFYWDFENSRAKSVELLKNLLSMITAALRTHQPQYYIIRGGVIGFGDLSHFTWSELATLTTVGFKVQHVPRRTSSCTACGGKVFTSTEPQDDYWNKTDAADIFIIQSMLVNSYKIRAPANILLVSGDKDFVSTITALKDRGFKVMIAQLDNSNELLRLNADVTWMWEDMKKGGRCSFTSTPYSKRRAEHYFYP